MHPLFERKDKSHKLPNRQNSDIGAKKLAISESKIHAAKRPVKQAPSTMKIGKGDSHCDI